MTTVTAGARPANPDARSNSLILALHARYEAAWAEYNLADAAQPAKPEDTRNSDWALHYPLKEAMLENGDETAILQQAILHQVPATDEELTILAYHVANGFDPTGTRDKAENAALDRGLISIFDYLVSQGRADMETTGHMFSSFAMLAFHRVRRRTGKLEA